MPLVSFPTTKLQGTLAVPGDKSISHRAIIFGALAEGTTIIQGFLVAEDCMKTVSAFQAMGVSIALTSDTVVINGVGKYGLKKPLEAIDCGNSGTTMRLMAGVLSAQTFDSQLIGDSSLSARPMARVADPLEKMGACIHTQQGKAPLQITGGQTLQGLSYVMPKASAQVKSALLLAALYAKGETQVIESEATRNHTEHLLAAFAYPFAVQNKTITINSLPSLQATTIDIPGDLSAAAFFIVAASILTEAALTIKNVGINPTRTGILNILEAMGAQITIHNKRQFGQEPVADIYIQAASLHGIDIPSDWVVSAIDEFPIIMIAASVARGTTTIQNAEELRHKESDRIAIMVQGLKILGIHIEELADGVIIQGGTIAGGEVDAAHDHRVAMAFAIAGLVAKKPLFIHHAESIVTSFPSFIYLAQQLGLRIEEVL